MTSFSWTITEPMAEVVTCVLGETLALATTESEPSPDVIACVLGETSALATCVVEPKPEVIANVPSDTDTDSPFQVPEPHVPRPQPTLIDYL